MTERPLRIAVLCPHFAPDTAPTGVVITRIVHELAARGHEVHVVTALPWYAEHRIEVPCHRWNGMPVMRVSAHAHTTDADIEALVAAMPHALKGSRP